MPLHYEKQDGVAVITLDNPPINVFTPDLHKAFYEILRDFLSDRAVKVGIWTAAGERAFCGGDDIKTPRPERTQAEVIERHFSMSRDDEAPEYPGWEAEVLSLNRYKPIVAAVNGPCMGQGLLYLLTLTDIRLATPNATFGFPEITYGMGGAGGASRLGRQIPHTAAMWMLLTGDPFDADHARDVNLINDVVAPEALMDRAHEVAARIARHPALALRVEMEAYQRAQDMNRTDAMAFTSHLYRLQRAALDTRLPSSEDIQSHKKAGE